MGNPDNSDVIRFDCNVAKVQTLADGGIRVTFDLAESEIPAMALLVECKRRGWALSAKLERARSDPAASINTDSF